MSYHWQVSRKVLMERRRRALLDAGYVPGNRKWSECEKLLGCHTGF